MHSETESDSSYGVTTDYSTKHDVYNDALTKFYRITVLLLENIRFGSNVIKFVLGLIEKIENIITEMKKNKIDETPSLPKYFFQMFFLFRRFILENQNRLPLRNMAKKII